jgi:hypothetical protein
MILKISKGLLCFFLILGILPMLGGEIAVGGQMLFLVVLCVLPVWLFVTTLFIDYRDSEYDAVVKHIACSSIATQYTNHIEFEYPDAYDDAHTAVYNAIFNIDRSYNTVLFNDYGNYYNCDVTMLIVSTLCCFFASLWFCAGIYYMSDDNVVICYVYSAIWVIIWLLSLFIKRRTLKEERNLDRFFRYCDNGNAELICSLRDKGVAQHLASYRNYIEKSHEKYEWEVKYNSDDGTYNVVGKPLQGMAN